MYGRLPPRKRFLRHKGIDGQLLPCIRPSVRPRAAGLDEIRGSAPDYQVELEALWFSRVLPTHGPTVVPSRRRSPPQLVEACHPSATGVMDCSLPFVLRAD
jgi:hypothetical protein